jgi:hypothetical protein
MTLTQSWPQANQRYLMAALGVLRARLEAPSELPAAQNALLEAAQALPAPAALETLGRAFGLSAFEREVLLLCAGPELDASFAQLLQKDPLRPFPSFGLALATLGEPHWSALSPAGPLRRWRLVELSGSSLTQGALRLDERILHYLTGTDCLDERLWGYLQAPPPPAALVASQQALAERVVAAWLEQSPPPVVQLYGGEAADRLAVAARAAQGLDLRLLRLPVEGLPANPADLEGLQRLLEREGVLGGCVYVLEAEGEQLPLLRRFVEGLGSSVLTSTREPPPPLERPTLRLEVRPPSPAEQLELWRKELSEAEAAALVSQFNLSARAIQDLLGQKPPPRDLWQACRLHARRGLEDLAQRIEATATWDDLVLPTHEQRLLRELAAQVRQRSRVYESWGFAHKGRRGLGISALFAGPSGTGKTLAAEVLAAELGLDLYRIDLAQVVSKYIGETEKNLRRVFDAAEGGGAILLFDEADALFGKRSEVKDSHDRYANLEVSYLLQRMEQYRGLAILTTNLKESLDSAFLRRICFVVQFPHPDHAQRSEIWRRVFPPQTPLEPLDYGLLARLSVTGGNIRNIALYAAFLAAEEGVAVGMRHLKRAAQVEYGKLERPLTEAEIGGWG